MKDNKFTLVLPKVSSSLLGFASLSCHPEEDSVLVCTSHDSSS